MTYEQTTQVPNILFDLHLPSLTDSELKILLIIIRQTYGWIDRYTGNRKLQDRISHSQFITKTGLSRRVISKALKNLVSKGLVNITCRNGNNLQRSFDRRGKTSLIYSTNMCTKIPKHVHLTTPTCAQSAHNKTNYTKENKAKIRINRPMQIGEIIKRFGIL
ncbi:MAG: replication protein [Saprospiraceae bacterium]|nr:replication protein [Saprospiraceae bacterium]